MAFQFSNIHDVQTEGKLFVARILLTDDETGIETCERIYFEKEPEENEILTQSDIVLARINNVPEVIEEPNIDEMQQENDKLKKQINEIMDTLNNTELKDNEKLDLLSQKVDAIQADIAIAASLEIGVKK